MAYQYKPVQGGPILNLAAKMDNRTSNEYLDVDPNSTGFVFTNLENADLFNTKALSTRLGVQDIANGIVNVSGGPASLVNTDHDLAAGTVTGTASIIMQNPGVIFDYYGSFYIPSGNGLNIFTGTYQYSSSLTPSEYATLGSEVDYEVKFKVYVYPMTQVPLPSSGISWMSGTSGAGTGGQIPHDIGLSGNYNVPPYPAISIQSTSLNSSEPVAISDPLYFTPGPYTFNGSNYVTPTGTLSVTFTAPFEFNSGVVYWFKPMLENTSGTASRSINLLTVQNGATDISPNTLAAQEFLYIGAPANQNYAVRKAFTEKTWLKQDLYKYQSPSYLLTDIGAANRTITAPMVSGSFITAPNFVARVETGVVTGLSFQPPSFQTTTPEFGQVIRIPSGTWTIYGSYFYANTYTGVTTAGQVLNNWTRNAVSFPSLNYNAGYASNFSSIDSSAGAITGSNYRVNNRTILASFSGNHVFSEPIDYPLNPAGGPIYNLDKLYSLYENPVTITTTGSDYLLSFKFYDYNNGGPMTDYVNYNLGNTYTFFVSPFQIAVNQTTNGSGSFVYNWSGNGVNFNQYNNNLAVGGNDRDLVCGLIYVPSGNAITSVYDYRVGENRSQRVIITQQDQIRSFPIQTPNAQTVIHTGAAVGNNHKWTHATYQNLLFSHQYSQTSGVCWDQIYTQATGNDTQLHGLRPSAYVVQVSGIGPSTGTSISSGTEFSILLATQMASGGLRSSEPITVTATGVPHTYIGLTGTDIFRTSGLSTNSQYLFDVLPQATYVFATGPSGSVYYLAGLVDISGNSIPNPLPNSGTFPCYINDVSSTTLTQQVSQVLLDYDQFYLTAQVDTPKFKKLIVFHDYLIGVGDTDNPSRLWFSEQFGPQIWGIDGTFTGYLDIDLNNGSPITGIEIYKDYLIVFKYNSTYRLNYTQDPSTPFYVTQISDTIGNLGFFGTVSTDYGIFGLSQFGPFLATHAGVDTIGDEIIPYFSTLDHTDLTFAVAIHDRLRQQIYWSITSQETSPSRNNGLTYSYAEKSWNIRRGGMWNAAGIIGDEDNFNLLYCGDVLGQLQQISVGDTDEDVIFNDSIGTIATRNISLVAETPWMNFGNAQNLKQLRNLRLNCESSAQKLRVDVYFDQDEDTIRYTRYLNMNVPVINRVISLAGQCRTVKLVFTTVGNPAPVRINSMQLSWQDLGPRINI